MTKKLLKVGTINLVLTLLFFVLIATFREENDLRLLLIFFSNSIWWYSKRIRVADKF